jgi:hypothetical protein
MPLTIILLAVLLAAGIYVWTVRHDLRLQLPQLWQSMRTHPLVTGLLILYSIICGILLVTMRVSPLHMLLFLSGEFTWDTAPVAIMLALPIAAGVCGGWWAVRRDVARPDGGRILNHGILAGLMAMVLPALLGTIGLGLATWTDEEVYAGWIWMVVGALLWAGASLALGVVLGVIGALLSVSVHRLRRQSGPAAPAGVL